MAQAVLDDPEKLKEAVEYVFSQADTDANGKIDATEFTKHLKDVYKEIGLDIPSDEDIGKMMESFDTNNDGVLDKGEFTEYVKSTLKKHAEKEAA